MTLTAAPRHHVGGLLRVSGTLPHMSDDELCDECPLKVGMNSCECHEQHDRRTLLHAQRRTQPEHATRPGVVAGTRMRAQETR